MKISTKNRKIIIFLTIISCFIFGLSFSQTTIKKQKNDFWDHIRFGGGIGLSIGDNYFSGTLAPSAVYQFDDMFSLGFGLSGSYDKRQNLYKSTVLGGSIIGLFNPIQEIQLSSEFEQLNVNRKFDNHLNFQDENYWYPALFIGAGYRSGNFTIGFRYDVLYDESKSIYVDPWMPFIRFYF